MADGSVPIKCVTLDESMSGSPENILLYLGQREEERIRGIFAELAKLGFPRQHQRPHISITFAPELSEEVVLRASQLLPSVVPATIRRVGTVVFGTKRKQTVAWLLETTDELEIAAREISALNAGGRGPRWTPHLTMGLRLPRKIVPEYLRALDEVGSAFQLEFTAVRAAWWRPGTQQLNLLVVNDISWSQRQPAREEFADRCCLLPSGELKSLMNCQIPCNRRAREDQSPEATSAGKCHGEDFRAGPDGHRQEPHGNPALNRNHLQPRVPCRRKIRLMALEFDSEHLGRAGCLQPRLVHRCPAIRQSRAIPERFQVSRPKFT